MRMKIINFFKRHPFWVNLFWFISRGLLNFYGLFVKQNKKMMIFVSLGGRDFGDSPRAIYEKFILDNAYNDWIFVWAFSNPTKFDIPRGIIIKIDTLKYFNYLFRSKVWICNSDIDRCIGLKKKGVIRVETWHGSALKKGYGEENETAIGGKKAQKNKNKKPIDSSTIRCAQGPRDVEILSRLFHADPNCFVKGLPRNDALVNYSMDSIIEIKKSLGLPLDKKIILYTPTFREYQWDKKRNLYFKPPLNLEKWQSFLGKEYVFLFRAHYAVLNSLDFKDNNFAKNVSSYPNINDLYLISDIMISDYSSTFIDFSILERPMMCFGYDYDEFNKKRGFFWDLSSVLPCAIDSSEDEIIKKILELNYEEASKKSLLFKKDFAPWVGRGTRNVIEEIERRLNNRN